MMTEEEIKKGEECEDEKPKEAPKKPLKKKDIEKVETPKATVPPIEPKKPPETKSGIDVTANMDPDQKKTFEEIRNKAQVIPQMVSTQRPFCKRMAEIKARRAARLARR